MRIATVVLLVLSLTACVTTESESERVKGRQAKDSDPADPNAPHAPAVHKRPPASIPPTPPPRAPKPEPDRWKDALDSIAEAGARARSARRDAERGAGRAGGYVAKAAKAFTDGDSETLMGLQGKAASAANSAQSGAKRAKGASGLTERRARPVVQGSGVAAGGELPEAARVAVAAVEQAVKDSEAAAAAAAKAAVARDAITELVSLGDALGQLEALERAGSSARVSSADRQRQSAQRTEQANSAAAEGEGHLAAGDVEAARAALARGRAGQHGTGPFQEAEKGLAGALARFRREHAGSLKGSALTRKRTLAGLKKVEGDHQAVLHAKTEAEIGAEDLARRLEALKRGISNYSPAVGDQDPRALPELPKPPGASPEGVVEPAKDALPEVSVVGRWIQRSGSTGPDFLPGGYASSTLRFREDGILEVSRTFGVKGRIRQTWRLSYAWNNDRSKLSLGQDKKPGSASLGGFSLREFGITVRPPVLELPVVLDCSRSGTDRLEIGKKTFSQR
jgi:hypothetical protein